MDVDGDAAEAALQVRWGFAVEAEVRLTRPVSPSSKVLVTRWV